MSDLKKYDVDVNGYKTTFLYSDEDAKVLGLTGKHQGAKAASKPAPKAEPKASPAPENKAAAAPSNK
jgi:hypothetical protein